MNLEVLKNNYYLKDVKSLNQILISKELNNEEKKIAFEIANYIIGKSTNYYFHNESIIKLFNDFCQCSSINKKSCFNEILTIIKEEIDKVEYKIKNDNSKKVTDNKQEKINQYEIKQELIGRIYTTMEVALQISDYNNNDFYEIIKKLLRTKMNSRNNNLIPKLVKNSVLKNNIDKLKITIDVALQTNTEPCIGNGWDITSHIFNILTDEGIINFDDDNYRKVVELALYNIQPYIMDIAINHQSLTSNKKLAIINYYSDMMKNYLQEYSIVSEETAKKEASRIIFKVVYSELLLSMDDETYTKTLNEIKNNNKPFSSSILETSIEISDEQKAFAYKLIKEGKVRPPKQRYNFYKKPEYDYKELVALAATSKPILTLPIEEYKNILTIIDKHCQETENLNYSDDFNKYIVFSRNQINVKNLLLNENIINITPSRLIFVIKEILSIHNRTITDNIREFSCHENSLYYTDEEFKKVINYIKTKPRYLIMELFVNENVPFMEDKSILFQTTSYSDDYIKSVTERLNQEGKYNMNMYHIFNGVDEEIIKNVTGNDSIKVKKLIKQQKANN